MKLAVKIVPICIVLLVLLVAIASFWLDSMIKAGLETIGPRLTGTAVRLDHVRVSLLSGRGEISGLVIGNPEGFQTESAFKLADTRIHLYIGSIFSNRVVIDEIVIDSPDVTYERGRSGSNIDKIQKNVEAFGTSAPAGKRPPQAVKENSQKKFQINRLAVKNGRIRLSTAFIEGKTVQISLPDIEIKDIGKGPKGATLQEVSSRVFAAIEADVSRAVASAGKNLAPELGKAGGTAKEIAGQAGKTASDVIKNFRGLFGK